MRNIWAPNPPNPRAQVDVVDVWTEHTPWPFNRMPQSYGFMVKHSFLWWTSYTLTQPRCVHVNMQRLTRLVSGRRVAAALLAHAPDLVVSVHPLMQFVPLRVLWQLVRAGTHRDCLC